MNTPHTPPAVSESRPMLSLRGKLIEFWRDHPETGTPQPCLVATLAPRLEPFGPRLIACWNSCQGMADPAAEIASLRAQRDELLTFARFYLDSESTTAECDRLAKTAIANATRQ